MVSESTLSPVPWRTPGSAQSLAQSCPVSRSQSPSSVSSRTGRTGGTGTWALRVSGSSGSVREATGRLPPSSRKCLCLRYELFPVVIILLPVIPGLGQDPDYRQSVEEGGIQGSGDSWCEEINQTREIPVRDDHCHLPRLCPPLQVTLCNSKISLGLIHHLLWSGLGLKESTDTCPLLLLLSCVLPWLCQSPAASSRRQVHNIFAQSGTLSLYKLFHGLRTLIIILISDIIINVSFWQI